MRVAKSAQDPDDPVSHIGLDTAALYLDDSKIDPWKTNWPTSDLRVDVSYAGGSSQPVEVLAKRAVGAVTLHYSINGEAADRADRRVARRRAVRRQQRLQRLLPLPPGRDPRPEGR